MKFRTSMLTTALCLVSSAVLAADVKTPVKPGKWETTIQMEMPGMPTMPAHSYTHCVTPEDAAKAENTIPRMQKESKCVFDDVKIDGKTVSWKVTCPQPNGAKMTGSGQVTYTGEGDSYKGDMHMTMPQVGEMTTHFTGKRVGECDK